METLIDNLVGFPHIYNEIKSLCTKDDLYVLYVIIEYLNVLLYPYTLEYGVGYIYIGNRYYYLTNLRYYLKHSFLLDMKNFGNPKERYEFLKSICGLYTTIDYNDLTIKDRSYTIVEYDSIFNLHFKTEDINNKFLPFNLEPSKDNITNDISLVFKLIDSKIEIELVYLQSIKINLSTEYLLSCNILINYDDPYLIRKLYFIDDVQICVINTVNDVYNQLNSNKDKLEPITSRNGSILWYLYLEGNVYK